MNENLSNFKLLNRDAFNANNAFIFFFITLIVY